MDKRKLLGAVFVIVAIGLGFLIYFIAKDQWWDDSKESSQPAKQESKKDNSKDDEKIEESKKKINHMDDKSENREKNDSDDDSSSQENDDQKESKSNLDQRTEYFIKNMFTNLNQENYQRIKNKLSTICTPHFMHKYFRDKDSQYNFYMDVHMSGFDIYESRKPRSNGKVVFATFERETSPAHSGNTDIKPSHEEMTVQVIYKKVNGKMLVDDFNIQNNEDLDDTDDDSEEMN